MIQHIQIDHNTHGAITQAARDAGMAYDAFLAWIVLDWATTYSRRLAGKRDLVAALIENYGVIPGDD